MKADEKNKNKIGSLIEGPAYRDAIHIAVAPCVAGEELQPGEAVSFTGNGRIVNYRTNKRVGIVDPFLTDPVKEGERCWVFLYPGTAENLRHEWDHPDFRVSGAENPEAVELARLYLQQYAEAHAMTLEDLLAAVGKYVANGCEDAVLENDWNEYEVPNIFWANYLAYTGKTGTGNFWGCCV